MCVGVLSVFDAWFRVRVFDVCVQRTVVVVTVVISLVMKHNQDRSSYGTACLDRFNKISKEKSTQQTLQHMQLLLCFAFPFTRFLAAQHIKHSTHILVQLGSERLSC